MSGTEVLVCSAVEGFNEYILGTQSSEAVEEYVRRGCLPLALKLLQPLHFADLSPYFLF